MLFNRSHRLMFYTSVIFLSLTVQCEREKLSDDTYFGSKVMILGHRGMGQYYKKPGNTFESVFPATQIGADGCEIDIQLTKDTVLVLFHDDELNPRTSCSGRVYESTWQELKDCKYLALQSNICINSADELFSKLPDLNHLYFSFDCELDDNVANYNQYQDQFLRAIKRLCDKYDMSDNVFLEGGISFLKAAHKAGLSNKLFWASVVNESTIDTAAANSFTGLCAQVGDIGENANLAHQKGLYIMAYSPYNYYFNKDAIRKNIDILQTDDPISILKLFQRFNYEYIIP